MGSHKRRHPVAGEAPQEVVCSTEVSNGRRSPDENLSAVGSEKVVCTNFRLMQSALRTKRGRRDTSRANFML